MNQPHLPGPVGASAAAQSLDALFTAHHAQPDERPAQIAAAIASLPAAIAAVQAMGDPITRLLVAEVLGAAMQQLQLTPGELAAAAADARPIAALGQLRRHLRSEAPADLLDAERTLVPALLEHLMAYAVRIAALAALGGVEPGAVKTPAPPELVALRASAAEQRSGMRMRIRMFRVAVAGLALLVLALLGASYGTLSVVLWPQPGDMSASAWVAIVALLAGLTAGGVALLIALRRGTAAASHALATATHHLETQELAHRAAVRDLEVWRDRRDQAADVLRERESELVKLGHIREGWYREALRALGDPGIQHWRTATVPPAARVPTRAPTRPPPPPRAKNPSSRVPES